MTATPSVGVDAMMGTKPETIHDGQFSTRQLCITVSALCIYFAIVRYLGVIVGYAAALVIAVFTFLIGTVVAAAVLQHRGNRKLAKRLPHNL